MSGATEAGNISVGEAGTAQVLGVEGAVGIETLAKTQGDGVAVILSADVHTQISHHILAHIEHPLVALAEECDGPHGVLHLEVGVGLWHQVPFGRVNAENGYPLGVVVTC